MKIIEPSINLEWVTPSAMSIIEMAGRKCYKSQIKITQTSSDLFVRRLIKQGHESVLEHAVASFTIICDRGISHELVRHRIASFSQESTRYCNYRTQEGISFVAPSGLCTLSYNAWLETVGICEKAYNKLVDLGCAPQIARSVLPHSLKTELMMTANFREWRHLLKLRTASSAHPQARQIAIMILKWFKANFPIIVEDINAQ